MTASPIDPWNSKCCIGRQYTVIPNWNMAQNSTILALTILIHGPWILRKWCRWVYRIKNYTCCFARSVTLNHALILEVGTPWRCWLRHCSTSQKVVGLIPDGIIGISHWHTHNPFGRTMALGSTQHLTEMSTRNISWWGKDSQCIQLTTFPPSCTNFLEIWEPQPPGTLRAWPGL
jgi:hypothetical protein